MIDRVATARRMGTGGIVMTGATIGTATGVAIAEIVIVTAADGTVRAKQGAFRAASNLAPPSFFKFLQLMLPAPPPQSRPPPRCAHRSSA